MAFKLGAGIIEISASGLSSVTRGLGGLRSSLASVGSGLTGVLKGLGGFALGGAGIATLYQGARKFVDMLSVQEDAERRLNAMLKATGNTTGFTVDEMRELANELQKTSRYGSDATLSAMRFLATAKNIRGEEFKRATIAAQDMAAAMDMDLEAAMKSLSKALQDPLAGMAALRAANITLTFAQEQAIRSAMTQRDVQAAQRVLLEALEGRFKGSAEAMTQTWSGMTTQISNSISSIMATIGSGFLPIFLSIGRVLVNKVLPAIQTFTENTINKFLIVSKLLWSLIRPAFVTTGNSIITVFNYILPYLTMFKDWTVTAFYVALTAAQNWRLSLDIVWQGFLVGLGTAYDGVRWLFLDTIPRILVWARQNWQDILWDIVNFIGTVTTNIITNLWNWTKGVGDLFVGLGKTIYDVMLNTFEGLKRIWKKLLSGDFSNWGDIISETFNKNIKAMKTNFEGSLKNFTWTPLTQGFERETAKLELGPMVASEFTKTHKGKLAASMASMVSKVNANMPVKPQVDAEKIKDQLKDIGEQQAFEIGGQQVGGATIDLADMAKNLQSAAFKLRDPAKIAEDQLSVQKRQANTLDTVVSHLEQGNQLTQQMLSRVESMGVLG